MGKPGQVEDPEVVSCIKDSVKKIKNSGKSCGSFCKRQEVFRDTGRLWCSVCYLYGGFSYVFYKVNKNLKEFLKG